MAKLNIALVEPEIPQNTGNIARTCAATGAALHLIKPLGFSLDDRQMKRAGLCLGCGKETAGLPQSLLESNQDSCFRMPMRESLRSLNLSNSVAIAVYEALRQWDFEGLESVGIPRTFCWRK